MDPNGIFRLFNSQWADGPANAHLHAEYVMGLTVYTLGFVALFVIMYARIFAIGVLLALAPLAAVVWSHPNTRHYGGIWAVAFIGGVFSQPLVVALLQIASTFVLTVLNTLNPLEQGQYALTPALQLTLAGAAFFAAVPVSFFVQRTVYLHSEQTVSYMQSLVNQLQRAFDDATRPFVNTLRNIRSRAEYVRDTPGRWADEARGYPRAWLAHHTPTWTQRVLPMPLQLRPRDTRQLVYFKRQMERLNRDLEQAISARNEAINRVAYLEAEMERLRMANASRATPPGVAPITPSVTSDADYERLDEAAAPTDAGERAILDLRDHAQRSAELMRCQSEVDKTARELLKAVKQCHKGFLDYWRGASAWDHWQTLADATHAYREALRQERDACQQMIASLPEDDEDLKALHQRWNVVERQLKGADQLASLLQRGYPLRRDTVDAQGFKRALVELNDALVDAYIDAYIDATTETSLESKKRKQQWEKWKRDAGVV